MKTVLVTGATGNVGQTVVHALGEKGARVIAGVRNPQEARTAFPAGVELRRFAFEQQADYTALLTGVDQVFLVRPPAISNVAKYMFPFLEQLQQVGIEKVALLSVLGAETMSFIPHRKLEQEILRLGLPYLFLRPSFFMQNLNTVHCQDIAAGKVDVPAGRGETGFIDVRDIGAVAAELMLDEAAANRAVTLTGKEALDYYQVAECFTQVLGRPIRYTNPSLCRFYRNMRKQGHDRKFIFLMMGLYLPTRFGKSATVTNTVEQILHREPISMRQYVENYREAWETARAI